MAFFKCKMCGGSLEVKDGMTVCECEYCGTTQTIPKTRDDTAANIFNRANFLRSKCEFDKAQEIYEKIVNVDPNEAEAYWGIILCKYGIEYVEDPKTLKKIPTCHRTQLESVSSDPDYLSAVEHADAVQRSLYEKEAAEIDRLQKDILAIVRNEKPFDVFICYKETDDSGRRTQDSVIANDIYYQLTQNGFKVFYAAITLEDKLGQEYEPYIFAALNSAKVMLVVGTRPEYFDAVWVKNEWSRFLKIAKSDRNKLLIPCYKDMSAYDLPEEFSHLQAQDMGKIGFINDVVRGIKKLVAAPMEKQATAPAAPVKAASSNVENLLKRGMLCLEDEQWAEANKFFEEVLNEDVEESRAYLGKMLAEFKLSSESRLNILSERIENNSNFQKAVRFGDVAMKEKLENYRKQCIYNVAFVTIDKIEITISDLEKAITIYEEIADFDDAKEQIEECREKIKEIKYRNAVECYQAERISDIETAIKIFENLGEFKDSAEMIDKCREKIEDIKRAEEEEKRRREEAEAQRQELARRKQKKRKRIIKITVISVISIIVLTVAAVILIPMIKELYAINIMEQGNYDEAIAIFEELDNESKAEEAKFQKGEYLLEQGNYDEAIAIFEELDNESKSKEAKQKKREYLLKQGENLLEQGKYDEAITIFEELDNKSKLDEAKYQKRENFKKTSYQAGLKALEEKDIKTALQQFQNSCGYNDAEKYTARLSGVVSSSELHTVGLKSDGTVVTVGKNDDGQCNVSDWSDIVAVSAGEEHTVGLKSDGTVVAVGNNDDGECDVSSWTDIVAVSAGRYHTVGLKSDGTVVAVGSDFYGRCDVSDWSDIVAVSAGYYHTVGLKSDGTVVAVGENFNGQCNVSHWTDIVAVSAGKDYTVGLKSDGTVRTIGNNGYGQLNVEDWKDIAVISARYFNTIGIKSDGTLVAVGDNDDGQCDVSGWKDIVFVSAGRHHTVGLKSDGTVVAVGNNDDGQCNVSKWKNIAPRLD